MKVHENFGLNLTPLGPRLLETKQFNKCDTGSSDFLNSCSPRKRNRILNYGVGIEIEVENYRIAKQLAPIWIPKEDGSLRNGGRELVTEYGTRVFQAHEALQNVQENFALERKAAATYNEFNERCSVHIHIDVRNLSMQQLNSVLLTYMLFEHPLFRFAGEDRYDNIFCVPLAQSVAGQKGVSFANLLQSAEKYSALNFKTLREFGTLEFRHMEGNDNADRIFRWILCIASLVFFAENTTNEEIVDRIVKLKYESQYEKFIEDVFGILSHRLIIDTNELDNAISDAKLFIHKGPL